MVIAWITSFSFYYERTMTIIETGVFFFFKQKTAYEISTRDWSSDVCSSDLDLLTMIGFIIVLGLVVNNTILLVARTRQAEAEGMTRVEAVRSSLETRLRPIFSSTLTAIFGMLPLVIVPGPGAEIYRGLGAVIVGGILVSHVFTLVLMPAMLRLGERSEDLSLAPITPILRRAA